MKLKTIYTKFIPEILEDNTLYVSKEYKVSIHKCACGCGEQSVQPFNHKEWWILTENNDETITLSPSILNNPCKAHYFIRHNEIVWA